MGCTDRRVFHVGESELQDVDPPIGVSVALIIVVVGSDEQQVLLRRVVPEDCVPRVTDHDSVAARRLQDGHGFTEAGSVSVRKTTDGIVLLIERSIHDLVSDSGVSSWRCNHICSALGSCQLQGVEHEENGAN